ncbi:hypothetical protein GGI03_006427 [Coemansia sp. RSA 2337]|nr:hypothetical protein LPJ71_004851 [Coemansia sp. S17]KAJ2016013.1 hypothetical protein GGI14_003909 [Coemansia sp. S680]KAJ2034236.1 hypothetical protein H4S03_005121 [Coemansia sp. S3946]KAJ2049727.1 hypothetical protein GGI08_005667 [Coemansia sp. S2]KAJ2051778.1 hypothetical protein H4S04_001774 [Coemansia sp. S16]KAJ2055183.1 hypothetical protein GGH13_007938 [Coemansia sp. S155-1]KAJ2094881.1 hypothetical protein GGI09_005162 [Coemansia sp. S100]KAJ2105274.1 hypothetical protein GGI1
MGPRRGGSDAKGPKKVKGTKKDATKSSPEYSMSQLLTKTQELMDDNDYETALKFAAKAIEMDENNTQALLLAAIIQLESGEVEPAINCLLKCAEISPERGFEKYMYLGQFAVELEAVKYFQLGVNAMQRDLDELSTAASKDQASSLKRKMAEAYVAMTEIYLTDCCFEEDAEKKCEELLQNGLLIDPECPEVYQTMASVRLSQNRPDDARDCVAKSMALWANKDLTDPTQIPSYENRLALVRLLLELDDKEKALALLEQLQKEDDENVDAWYLFGWTYHLQSEDLATSGDDEDKTELLRSARECFKQAIKLANMLDYENDGLIDHALELVAAIDAIVPPTDGDDEEEDDVATAAAVPNELEWDDEGSEDEDVEMGS